MIWFSTKPIETKVNLILICHLVFYDGERRSMGRKSEPIYIESVEFDYIGTDAQFNTFLKSIVKDYLSENNLLPDESKDEIKLKKSA